MQSETPSAMRNTFSSDQNYLWSVSNTTNFTKYILCITLLVFWNFQLNLPWFCDIINKSNYPPEVDLSYSPTFCAMLPGVRLSVHVFLLSYLVLQEYHETGTLVDFSIGLPKQRNRTHFLNKWHTHCKVKPILNFLIKSCWHH